MSMWAMRRTFVTDFPAIQVNYAIFAGSWRLGDCAARGPKGVALCYDRGKLAEQDLVAVAVIGERAHLAPAHAHVAAVVVA